MPLGWMCERGATMANEKTQKQLIFDPMFAKNIKDTCANNPPEGSTSKHFSVVEQSDYGVLMYPADKEAQALEVLFIAAGRAWHEAKGKI